ncbi:hypothetical protein ACFPLB_15735 [Aquamicrobium segne]|uniref:Glutelin n=1 Tax=Aquamicrobium segne TaxID=469547 RepID=A0ABW0H0D2_9HYPH
MICKHPLKMTIAGLAFVLPWSISARAAFECPTQPLETAHNSIIAAALPTGAAFDDRTALTAALTALHAEGVSMPIIVDTLIAAYCPTIANETGLSDAQKTQKVNQFALRMTRMVYQLDSTEAIILEVNFPPLVMNSIEAKAKEAGVSAADWVESIVQQALD